MSAPIHTWLDGYLALRHRAFDERGSIVLSTGERWPRTGTPPSVVEVGSVVGDGGTSRSTPRIAARFSSRPTVE